MKLVEKGVAQKEPRFINRAIRNLHSLRRKTNDTVLRAVVMAYYPPGKSRDGLLPPGKSRDGLLPPLVSHVMAYYPLVSHVMAYYPPLVSHVILSLLPKD